MALRPWTPSSGQSPCNRAPSPRRPRFRATCCEPPKSHHALARRDRLPRGTPLLAQTRSGRVERMRVALVTCQQPPEPDPDAPLVAAALTSRGHTTVDVAWDAPD